MEGAKVAVRRFGLDYSTLKGGIMKKLLLLAALVPLISFASDWRLVAQSNNAATMYFLDAESLRQIDTVKQAWIFTINEKPARNKEKSSKDLYAIQCASQSYSWLASATYDDKDELLSSSQFERPVWSPAVPDSVAAGWLKVVCASPKDLKKLPSFANPLVMSETYWTNKRDLFKPPSSTSEVAPSAGAASGPGCTFDRYGIATCPSKVNQ